MICLGCLLGIESPRRTMAMVRDVELVGVRVMFPLGTGVYLFVALFGFL